MRQSALKQHSTRAANAVSYAAPVIAPVQTYSASKNANKALSREQRMVYLAVMGVLFFATLQCVRSTIVSAYKANILINQLSAVEASHDNVAEENQILHEQITQYNSPKGLEMLARERLNLVGPNEVLVNVFAEKPVSRQVAQNVVSNP